MPFLSDGHSRAAQCEGNSVSAGAHTSFPTPTLFHSPHFHLDLSFFTQPIFTWLFLFHSVHFKSEGFHSVCVKLQRTYLHSYSIWPFSQGPFFTIPFFTDFDSAHFHTFHLQQFFHSANFNFNYFHSVDSNFYVRQWIYFFLHTCKHFSYSHH